METNIKVNKKKECNIGAIYWLCIQCKICEIEYTKYKLSIKK
jgi:hypothetical protein